MRRKYPLAQLIDKVQQVHVTLQRQKKWVKEFQWEGGGEKEEGSNSSLQVVSGHQKVKHWVLCFYCIGCCDQVLFDMHNAEV